MADFDAMQTFVAILQTGSFRGAALSLRIPRSTVSQRVARLEERLGVRLLERTTRTLHATAAGRAYFESCLRILADVEEAERAMTEQEGAARGVIRVASSLLFGHAFLSPIAAEFALKHPAVELELVAKNGRVNVIEDGFDLAVMFMEASEDSSLIARKLESVEHRICASPGYVAANGAPATPKEASEHTCIAHGESRQAVWRFERGADVQRVTIHGRMGVNSFLMAHDAALRGVGIASLPTFLCGADVRAGRLVSLFPDWVVNRTEMRVVYPSQRYLAPRVRLFIEALVTGYNESIARARVLDRVAVAPTKERQTKVSKKDVERRPAGSPRVGRASSSRSRRDVP